MCTCIKASGHIQHNLEFSILYIIFFLETCKAVVIIPSSRGRGRKLEVLRKIWVKYNISQS
jgi:hypothetical protein